MKRHLIFPFLAVWVYIFSPITTSAEEKIYSSCFIPDYFYCANENSNCTKSTQACIELKFPPGTSEDDKMSWGDGMEIVCTGGSHGNMSGKVVRGKACDKSSFTVYCKNNFMHTFINPKIEGDRQLILNNSKNCKMLSASDKEGQVICERKFPGKSANLFPHSRFYIQVKSAAKCSQMNGTISELNLDEILYAGLSEYYCSVKNEKAASYSIGPTEGREEEAMKIITKDCNMRKGVIKENRFEGEGAIKTGKKCVECSEG